MTINILTDNPTTQTPHARHDGCPGGGDRPVGAQGAPRLAVLVVPAHARPPRPDLRRRLRTRYGIDKFQHLSLAPADWDAAIAGPMDSPGVERLRARLALARLAGARLVVVVGCSGADGPPCSWADVERLVDRLRSWVIPAEVVGVWTAARASRASRRSEPGIEDADGEHDVQWLAERKWEDDGGRVHRAPAERTTNGRDTDGRRKHVLPEHRRVHPGMPERRQSRHLEAGDVFGFRPGLAELAAR